MRTNFFFKFKSADEDELHSVPIQDMGNYHEYLKNQAAPLRELEAQLVRQHMFGNPFKLVSKDQKTSMFGADEIDEVLEESAENQVHKNQIQPPSMNPAVAKRGNGLAGKRRKGPLSRRENYLRNLYTNISGGSSTITESDDSSIPSIDDSINESEKSVQNCDVANLKDFDDVEMQPIDLIDDKTQIIQIQAQVAPVQEISNVQQSLQQLPQQSPQQTRPLSSMSTSSTDSTVATTCLCDNYLEQSYVQLKVLCVEEIKRPGRDHSKLFQLIQNSQLSIKMRQFLIKELIYDAQRFKRVKLVDLMTKYNQLLSELEDKSPPGVNHLIGVSS